MVSEFDRFDVCELEGFAELQAEYGTSDIVVDSCLHVNNAWDFEDDEDETYFEVFGELEMFKIIKYWDNERGEDETCERTSECIRVTMLVDKRTNLPYYIC
ncbi:MAG: hypothetical protein OEV44_09675 [Spirochaetota bacterium]|nr:hypothetical protein [Spirochaetota bacterium]